MNIFVVSLARDVREEDLQDSFAAFGKILKVLFRELARQIAHENVHRPPPRSNSLLHGWLSVGSRAPALRPCVGCPRLTSRPPGVTLLGRLGAALLLLLPGQVRRSPVA